MRKKRFRANFRFILSICLIVFLLGLISIYTINWRLRQHALDEAKEKAMILLDRNIATHTYFSHQLKPAIFEKIESISDEKYFDPRWMSSTYAVREVDKYYQLASKKSYYYKEAAINARSPENEADDFEREFISNLNQSSDIMEPSEVKYIDDAPFLVVLRRGESMGKSCLRCHSDPEVAPDDLIKYYGAERSFGRYEGEVVSAISIRVPLASAFSNVNKTIIFLAFGSVVILLLTGALATYFGKRWLYDPIANLSLKADSISKNPEKIGIQIELPLSEELAELCSAFNSMSLQLKEERDQLEIKILERTQELNKSNKALEQEIMLKEKSIKDLKKAMSEIKTLSGLLPICAHCKKIRDDQGYWNSLELYLQEHSDATFSHGICQDCLKLHYPDYTPKS
ncbi:MAG: DUF3365 domain-containing protein [Desulfobacter sp.]|nr:MAG: DUF3365 domain-containing protein [Desulfobacter sp.]